MDNTPKPLHSAHPDFAAALKECRRAFLGVALFSGMVNMLMLAGPLYMLQVFDRVLAGNTVGTLAIMLLAVIGFLTGRPEFLDIGLTYLLQSALPLARDRSRDEDSSSWAVRAIVPTRGQGVP